MDILLASANPQVIAAAQPVLAAAGYGVLLVNNGPDALHYTGDSQVDLYILDYALPMIDGLRLAGHLCRSYEIPRERILLLYPADLPSGALADTLAPAVLITPFTGVELILSVMRHLGLA